MIRLLGLVSLLLATAAGACDHPWSGILLSRTITCCPRYPRHTLSRQDEVGDVALWCSRGPRRSLYLNVFVLHWPTGPLGSVPTGPFRSRACRVGPHFTHRGTWQVGAPPGQAQCCPVTITAAAQQRPDGPLTGVAGVIRCRRQPSDSFAFTAPPPAAP
jgi:hypothetical protein